MRKWIGNLLFFVCRRSCLLRLQAQSVFRSGRAPGAHSSRDQSERMVRAGLRSQGIHEGTFDLDYRCRHRADQVGGLRSCAAERESAADDGRDAPHQDGGAEYFGYLDAAVKMILDAGLAVEIDMHPDSDFKARLAKEDDFVERFADFWSTVAQHYASLGPGSRVLRNSE